MYSGVVTGYCSCSTTNPAEYIPTWPSLSWVSELINKKDSSCVKLVRSKLSQFSAIIVPSAIMCENLTVYFRVCLDAAREHSWILRKQRGLKSRKKINWLPPLLDHNSPSIAISSTLSYKPHHLCPNSHRSEKLVSKWLSWKKGKL